MSTEPKPQPQAMTQVLHDDPRMVAWRKYVETDSFANSMKWATSRLYDDGRKIAPEQCRVNVEGSLWAAFIAGFDAAHRKAEPASPAPAPVSSWGFSEHITKLPAEPVAQQEVCRGWINPKTGKITQERRCGERRKNPTTEHYHRAECDVWYSDPKYKMGQARCGRCYDRSGHDRRKIASQGSGELSTDVAQTEHHPDKMERGGTPVSAGKRPSAESSPEQVSQASTLTERRAKFVYEGARIAAEAANSPIVPVRWEERESEFRTQFLRVIERQCGDQRSHSPEELHGSWMQAYFAMGWKYGKRYDRENKIHPDLVPYADLGQLERDKDAVFVALCEIARQWIYDGQASQERPESSTGEKES